MRYFIKVSITIALIIGCKPSKIKTENTAELQSINRENGAEIIDKSTEKIQSGDRDWIYGLLNELPTVADRELAAVIELSNSEENKFEEAQKIINFAFNETNGAAYTLLTGFSLLVKSQLTLGFVFNKEKVISFSKNILDVLIEAKAQDMLSHAASNSAIGSIHSQLNTDLIAIFEASGIDESFYLASDSSGTIDLSKFQESDFWKNDGQIKIDQLKSLLNGLLDHIINQARLTLNKIGAFFLANNQEEMKNKLTTFCKSDEILKALRALKNNFGLNSSGLRVPHFISKSEQNRNYYLYNHYTNEEKNLDKDANTRIEAGETYALIRIPSRFVSDFPLTEKACETLLDSQNINPSGGN